MIEGFKDEFGVEGVVGLAIVSQDECDTINESIPIFTDFLEHRRDLEKKNRHFTALASKFVTSQIIKEQKYQSP